MAVPGFTLVELLIVLAVTAILGSVALPALTRINTTNQMVTEINQLAAALRLARTEALKRGADVTICTASRDDSGTIGCDDTAHWHDGWVIHPAATPSERLAVFGGLSSGDSLQSLDETRRITFNRYGFSIHKETLVLCPPDGDPRKARALLLERAGRIVAAQDDDGSGIVDAIDGSDVRCPGGR